MPRGARATGYGAAGGRRDTVARSAKQKSRRERRAADPRVAAAMEETRRAQEELDARIKEETANPVLGTTVGAELMARLDAAKAAEEAVAAQVDIEHEAIEEGSPLVITEPVVDIEPEPVTYGIEYEQSIIVPPGYEVMLIPTYEPFDVNSVPPKNEGTGWVLGSARQMLIKGHSLAHVVQTTGWGRKWFDDIPVDEDGYGLGQEAWLASLDAKEKKKQDRPVNTEAK